MRVVIAGGRSRTDYLIDSLIEGGSEVVVVNADRAWCEYLSAHHDVPVICGDATKRYVLDDADIEGFDLIIALSDSDADNLVICQMAQHYFGIERQVCTAYNPRNVPVFKKLGITSVISATYLLSKLIEETSLEALGEPARPADGWRGSTGALMQVAHDDQTPCSSEPSVSRGGRWIHGGDHA